VPKLLRRKKLGVRWRWQSRCGLTVRIALIIALVPAPFDDHSPQHPLHIIPRRPPMRTGNVSVFLVPPPVPTPGKLCRPRGRHRLRPQQGLSAHPILTVGDHHFTRYPLTLVTTHLWDDLRMLPDTCQAAKAAECAQGDMRCYGQHRVIPAGVLRVAAQKFRTEPNTHAARARPLPIVADAWPTADAAPALPHTTRRRQHNLQNLGSVATVDGNHPAATGSISGGVDTTRWIAPVGAIRRIPHLAQ